MTAELKEASPAGADMDLSHLYQALQLTVPQNPVNVAAFVDPVYLADSRPDERIGAALAFFVQEILDSGQVVDRIDRGLLDTLIAEIDRRLSEQLDEILHHPQFQKTEALWRSLKFLVDRSDFRRNVRIDILDVSAQALAEDFEDASEVVQTGLYRHVYTDEYDTPGGEPYGALIADIAVSSSPADIGLLQNVSKVAAACHCPFLAAASPAFFGKNHMEELTRIDDLHGYLERSDFLRWNAFRSTEDSRYVGLALPRFSLRLPYGPDTLPVKNFTYRENVSAPDGSAYLWGNASFALAGNLVRSFVDNGWCVQVRGPESGGRVDDLPVHWFDAGRGMQMKIPTEILIPETREFEFANEGFIPLSFYKNRDYACFFSANSAQKPTEYEDGALTANMRVNARLPYIFLVSRIAHYLKVIQRENIGSTKSRTVLQEELSRWIRNLVTEMPDPGPDLIATHPLKAADVRVAEVPDNPGFFSVSLSIMPHFQIEGVDINLSLVAQMPRAK